MTKVCIVQRRLTHYRLPLFTALRESLAAHGVELVLLVGRGTAAEEKKNDAGALSWATQIPTTYFAGGRLCWQSIQSNLEGVDLLILTQENKLIQNHLMMVAPRQFKLAFWGHGANLQSSSPHGFKERFKRWTTNRVDWWFGYTQMTADLVQSNGFPHDRITILNNAVDTTELSHQRRSTTPQSVQVLRESLGFGNGPAAVFVGSLYADKRLGFLFAAAELIRQRIPDFHLLMVGDGPERDRVAAWCDLHPWAKWVGTRFALEKVTHLATAQVMLNPGLVGLGILDSFVCGVPMLTTDCGIHSPEISYLKNGVNGVITADDLNAYASACIALLSDVASLNTLRSGCHVSAAEFTIENMANRFVQGVLQCLAAPRYRHGRNA